MCDIAKIKHSTAKPCPYFVGWSACTLMLRTKQQAQQRRRWTDTRPNKFEFNLHSAYLRSYIRNQIQLANRCQHLSVFSTTNIPLVWCYKHELTYRECIQYRLFPLWEIHCDSQKPGSEKNQALSRHNWVIIISNKPIWFLNCETKTRFMAFEELTKRPHLSALQRTQTQVISNIISNANLQLNFPPRWKHNKCP